MPNEADLNTLIVKSGVDNAEPISSDGHFNLRLNDHATALLRVQNVFGDTVLLQVFPKADGLVKANPQISPLSTAVALVALQPTVITADPLIDALILAIIEQLPETRALADIIEEEISQGTFAFNRDYSPAVADGIGQIMNRLVLLSEALEKIDDIREILALNFSDRFAYQLEKFASSMIKPAHADYAFILECFDRFENGFSGHPGTLDDICISTNISATNPIVGFDITNQRTRWAFLGMADVTGSFNAFKAIPPRHIDIPGATGMVKASFGSVEIVCWILAASHGMP